MKNLITICKEENLSPNAIVQLYCICYNIKLNEYPDAINYLFARNYITANKELTDKGKRFSIDFLGNKEIFKISEPEDEIEFFIQEYRKLFKGYKPGSMGDKNACLNKMNKFFKDYPEYANKELIIKATKKYINSLNNYQYLKQADYFIFKSDFGKIPTSLLATYCEEVDGGIEEISDKSFTKMI